MLLLCKTSRGIVSPAVGQNERPLCGRDVDGCREGQNIDNDHGIADR
jgi:hypothetical protein